MLGGAGPASSGLAEVISFASFVSSTAMMDLPYVPENYYSFATSLHWVNMLFFTGADTRRRLIEEESSAVELFCKTIGVSPNMLFIYTLIGVFIVYMCCVALYALVVAIRSIKKKRLSKLGKPDMVLRFTKELFIRIVYYCSYPIAIVTVYQFYLYNIGMDSQVIYLSIAVLVVLVVFIWLYFGIRVTHSYHQHVKSKSDSFFIYRCLVQDWKYNMRYFWVARILTVWIRALFLASIRRPSPIQAAVFLFSAVVYFLLLLALMPYQHQIQNTIALIVALAYVCNTVLLLVFATVELPQDEADRWGLVQLVISLLVLAGMAVLCVVQRAQLMIERYKDPSKKFVDEDVPANDTWGLAREGIMRGLPLSTNRKRNLNFPDESPATSDSYADIEDVEIEHELFYEEYVLSKNELEIKIEKYRQLLKNSDPESTLTQSLQRQLEEYENLMRDLKSNVTMVCTF